MERREAADSASCEPNHFLLRKMRENEEKQSKNPSLTAEERRHILFISSTLKSTRTFPFSSVFFQAVKFLSALAADGTIPDVEAIISSNLSAGFDSVKESVSESIARQEKILAAVQVG